MSHNLDEVEAVARAICAAAKCNADEDFGWFREQARAAIAALDGVRARDVSEPFDHTAGYPAPTPEMLDGDPLFDAIWNAIKRWDIARAPGAGYAGATGNDVRCIYDAVRALDGVRGWRSMDSAPRDGTQVLLRGRLVPYHSHTEFYGDLDHDLTASGYFDPCDDAWCATWATWLGPWIVPTHWQPLPPPPEDKP